MNEKPPVFSGYTIGRKIEQGGMTDLYLAVDDQQRRVVIRCPKPPYAGNSSLRGNFAKAAEILNSLNHPNIIRLYESGRVKGVPYMVLEYVPSSNLRAFLTQRDAAIQRYSLDLVRQLASALYYLHSSGYVHLDIKPENILLRDDGLLVLIDFDLARKRPASPVKLRMLPGTPSYLPPETLLHHRVSEQTDIFSFGVTAYEMFSFQKPFPGSTPAEMLAAQQSLDTPPRPLRAFNPDVPAALESILFKCLAKKTDNRYPAVSLILKDLEALL